MTMHQVILWTLIGSVVGSALGTLLFVYVIQPLLERYVR